MVIRDNSPSVPEQSYLIPIEKVIYCLYPIFFHLSFSIKWRLVMAQRVKTYYISTFQMPSTCVSCGSPAEPGLFTEIGNTQSNWSGKRSTTLKLKFPVCSECNRVSVNRSGAKAVTVIGVIISLLACVLSGIVGTASSNGNFLITMASALVMFALTAWIFGRITRSMNEKGFTPEEKTRRRNLARAVQLQQFKAPGMFDNNGFIIFSFENMSFATAFALMNSAKLL